MNRQISANLLTDLGTTWSDYDVDEIYGDFTVKSGVASNSGSYQPGLGRSVGGVSEYLHSDMLGTLRQTSGTTGNAGASRVFTAFGEHLPGSTMMDRFGYIGAWGYQDTLDSTGAEAFPFLHVGARYYDPSSGRFLQRDPIGIFGGVNVYAYVGGRPTARRDASGLQEWIPSVEPDQPEPPGGMEDPMRHEEHEYPENPDLRNAATNLLMTCTGGPHIPMPKPPPPSPAEISNPDNHKGPCGASGGEGAIVPLVLTWRWVSRRRFKRCGDVPMRHSAKLPTRVVRRDGSVEGSAC